MFNSFLLLQEINKRLKSFREKNKCFKYFKLLSGRFLFLMAYNVFSNLLLFFVNDERKKSKCMKILNKRELEINEKKCLKKNQPTSTLFKDNINYLN